MIDVDVLEPGDEKAWDAFLAGSKGGLLYQSTSYRDLLVEHLGCRPEYLVARESGEIRGVLPLMWTSNGDSRLVNSLPFYGSHGAPVAESADSERALIDAWNERVADPGTLAGTMVENPFLPRELPAPVHGLTDERISQVTPLPEAADAETLLELVDSTARRNVRKARRVGFEIGRDSGALPDLARIHRDNMEAIGGLAKPEEFFSAIPRHFRPEEDYDVWVARLRDEIAAALLVFYFNGVAEYFTPAIEHEHRSEQPLALILIEAMAHAAGLGVRLWNWGGTWTSQDGVFRFKRKWGAREGRYRYWVQVNDERLLDASGDELRARFPHFYVAPFSALRGGS